MSSSSSPNATNARINDNIMNNNTSSSSSNTTTTSPFFKRQMIPCPPKYLLNYNMKKIFLKDIVAGVTVGFMAVPQAMSYATVAGLPPVFGLYNAFIGLLPYFLFGSSAFHFLQANDHTRCWNVVCSAAALHRLFGTSTTSPEQFFLMPLI